MELEHLKASDYYVVEGEFEVFTYKFDHQEQLTKWREAAALMLQYIMGVEMIDKFKFAQNMYRASWFTLMSAVNQGIGDSNIGYFTPQRLHEMTVDDIAKALGLPNITLSEQGGLINVWGPIYWKFLHLTSILIDSNQKLIEVFAALMVNFNLFLYCGICNANYKKMNPIRTVSVPMIQSKDPISTIFALHNSVNRHTQKTSFPREAFAAMYNIKYDPSSTYKIHYSQVVVE